MWEGRTAQPVCAGQVCGLCLCAQGRVCERCLPSPPSQWTHSINLKKLFVGLMNRRGVLSCYPRSLSWDASHRGFFPLCVFHWAFPFYEKFSFLPCTIFPLPGDCSIQTRERKGGGKDEKYQNHLTWVPQEPPCALAVEMPWGVK